ncbi:MAG: SagB/ThcOx family dehydrogenase [Candidatus Scalinduaceae bacterium]
MENNNSKNTIRYHEETKHYPNRYARSSGFLDWENQPNPFRFYEGTRILKLPFLEKHLDADYSCLYERKKNNFHMFSMQNIATFLELSLGLSAWKSIPGNSWSLRINPSSGNLHPTESHLILPPIPENNNQGCVCHYNPYLHALEVRAMFKEDLWTKVKKHFKRDGFLIGLSSIYWRESWKYGERAFRYCNHDVGHAMACLSFSANLLGWKIIYLNTLSDRETETFWD